MHPTRYPSGLLLSSRDARKQYHREMMRILRWSAALAALAIPVIIVVSAITEPRQSFVYNCPNPNSACDGVLVDRAQRWGPSALMLVVAWIVVALVVAAIIDHIGGRSDVEVSERRSRL
jgi:hypothetical protein